MKLDQFQWRATEGNTLGVQTAVLEGDPSKPGFYLTINRFPPGVMSRPHYHPDERNIANAVIKIRFFSNPDTGEAATRKAIPSDRFPNPYANETAARAANNNALPPDLSLITKARHGGAAYVYSLLTGYADAATYRNEKGEALPAANRPGQGLHFNPYFANLNIAMPPPLTADGQVSYADGTAATRDQMAKDVSAFLVWTAEPKLERRHATGLAVVVFLSATGPLLAQTPQTPTQAPRDLVLAPKR